MYSPVKRGSGHTEILQSRFYKAYHFIFSGYRLYKVRMFIIILKQLVRILGKPEEICLLAHHLYRAPAIGAIPVHQLGLCPERLTRCTVPSLVLTLVYISLFIHLSKNLLHYLLMLFIRGSYEFIIRYIHDLPQCFYPRYYFIYIFLGAYAFFLCYTLYLLAVFIRTCLEHDVVTRQPLEPGQRICSHSGVGMPYVELIAGIVNRCRYIKCFFIHYSLHLP